MKNLIVFAVPPLAGAVIGFVTNVVAIRMLFRPLKEIRVFGQRLPFTPGLLPRQRHKLADNIGAMVERELLTPEIIRRRLQREDVREKIKNSVSRYTEKILNTPLEKWLDSPSPSSLQDFAFSLFRGFWGAPGCGELIRGFADSLSDSLLSGDLRNRSLRDLLGPEGGEKITALAERLIREGLSSEGGRFSPDLLAGAEELYPQAVEHLIRFLGRNEIRRKLEEQGRLFLVEIILKLNVFQRFFISTVQYDKTLDERMPEIIDDLVGRLEKLLAEEETGRKIIQWAREDMGRIFSGGTAPENFARTLSRLLGAQMDKPLGYFFQNRETGEIRELLRNLLWRLRSMALSEPGAAEKGDGAEQEGGVSGLSSFFRAFSARFRERCGGESLGSLFSLGPEKKEALDSRIRDQILRLADEQSAAALGAINVRAMVAERIDSLEMIRVERIVLDVMANQLKWIDIFGALLGFLIGLSQSLFSWLLR
jgi:uncharacterized membrane-anchored protein YjiN (DUF445 family)